MVKGKAHIIAVYAEKEITARNKPEKKMTGKKLPAKSG
jgi:hypothetical protein